MHKLTTKMIAVVILLSTAVSSLATETTPVAPALLHSANPAPRLAPTVMSRKTALTSAELAKYQQMATLSKGLATTQVAGASSTGKTVLITVGVVVAVVAVAALIATNGGDHVPL